MVTGVMARKAIVPRSESVRSRASATDAIGSQLSGGAQPIPGLAYRDPPLLESDQPVNEPMAASANQRHVSDAR